MAYKIGECTLERAGTLRIPDSVDRETASKLLEHLKEKGFTGEAEQMEDRLTISMPKEPFTPEALENLAKLVENKGGLMARGFQADEIRLTVTEDAVSFPWFPFTASPDGQREAVHNPVVAEISECYGQSPRGSGWHEFRGVHGFSKDSVAVMVPQVAAAVIL